MSGPYRSAAPPGEEEEKASSGKVDLGAVRSQHSWPIGRGLGAVVAGTWTGGDVHEHGLAFRGMGTSARAAIPFDEVDNVFYDCGLLPGPPRVVIVTFDGRRLAIPSYTDDLDLVLDAIDRAVTRPLAVRAKEALARGEVLTFGPVVLELDGVVVSGQSLSWKGLASVVAERDALVFRAQPAHGRFGWVKVADVPHPSVLLDVLRLRTRVVIDGLRLRVGDEA